MTRDYTILSIDIGSDTGWCKLKNGIIIGSGVVSFVKKDSHPGDRFVRFHNWLREYGKDVQEIFYEDVPRFESAKAARSYCGYLATIQMFCLTGGKRMTNIKANSVKKEFSGHGNSDKTEMCRVAHKLGWKNGLLGSDLDHDECDAIACAWVLLVRRGVEPSFIAAAQ